LTPGSSISPSPQEKGIVTLLGASSTAECTFQIAFQVPDVSLGTYPVLLVDIVTYSPDNGSASFYDVKDFTVSP
jgi:hypothetical protein